MFVLDTNAVIHFFKNKGQVAEHLLATAPGDIGLPAVVVYELERGVRKSTQAHDRAAREHDDKETPCPPPTPV